MKAPALVLTVLITALAGVSQGAQDEEIVLGKPSRIQLPSRETETLVLDAGAQLHEQPRYDSPVREILEMSLELPVLDRSGPWVKVRFGSWQGWVRPDDGERQPDHDLPLRFSPDDERLLRARSLLSESAEPGSLGPFTLYTDVEDARLLEWLSAIARDVPRAYRDRFPLDPGSESHEIVVLFTKEADYREYEAAEPRIAEAHSRGYTSEGLSVLFAGGQDRSDLASVLIHELTHLLNRRVFPTDTPPWLEEGMAEDLAFCEVTEEGLIRLGTLTGESFVGLHESGTLTGPRAHLSALVSVWMSSTRPDLATLVSMDWIDFIEPENRAIHYTESVMLLRYLTDAAQQDLRHGLERYISAVARADLATYGSLWEAMGTDAKDLETDLYKYVTRQARAHGIQ